MWWTLIFAALAGPPRAESLAPALLTAGFADVVRVERTGELRLPLGEDGLAVVVLADDEEAAEAAFAQRLLTSATRWPPTTWARASADEIAGDGEGIAMVRVGAVVIWVRHHRDGAGDVVDRLLAVVAATTPR